MLLWPIPDEACLERLRALQESLHPAAKLPAKCNPAELAAFVKEWAPKVQELASIRSLATVRLANTEKDLSDEVSTAVAEMQASVRARQAGVFWDDLAPA